ncbi:MAG: RNA methyltransferase [Bacteroidetes bacterium]|nr:RNA methyltransferase [Bacteroidota bacterium]
MALSRNEIKLIKSLQDKKTRESNRLFVVEGVKLVEELLQQSSFKIESVFYTDEYTGKIPSAVHSLKISASELERISGLVTPNKVLAVVKYPPFKKSIDTTDPLILVLDEIKDPGNLGTILRTADWFGIKTVLASETTVDLFNPKVIQASMGAVYRIQFIQEKLETKLAELQNEGYKLVGADLQGENLYTCPFPTKMALIMGSESHGISEKISLLLDSRITIPQFGKTESLNVGIAAGIILSHYRKP